MKWKHLGAVAACVVALAGCSVSGHAVEEPGTIADGGAVDFSALDTGGYATDPAAPMGEATYPEDQTLVKAQRLISYLALGHEIDSSLTSGGSFNAVVRSGQLAASFIEGTSDLPVNQSGSLLFGASMSSEIGDSLKSNLGDRSVLVYVLKYRDAATAKQAAADFKRANVIKDDPDSDVKSTEVTKTLAGLPDTLVTQRTTNYDDDVSTSTYTPYGSYMVHVWVKAPKKETPWTEDAVRKTLDVQKPLIDEFEKTPGISDTAAITLDEHDILRYTVPTKDDKTTTIQRAVYTPRGIAHGWDNTKTGYDAYTKYSPFTARYQTSVARSETDEKAKSFVDFLVSDAKSSGFSQAESPKGLPNAQCFSATSAYGERFWCVTRVGRYVGSSDSTESLLDAQQQISAQHVTLTKADQTSN